MTKQGENARGHEATKRPRAVFDARAFVTRHMREILILALLLLAVHDVFGEHGFLAMWRTQKQMTELRADIDRLTKENNKMSSQVTALKTDPETIEHIAREQMGLAKPGELIFKLPPTENSGDSSTSH
jgi:cell division protein FtsB